MINCHGTSKYCLKVVDDDINPVTGKPYYLCKICRQFMVGYSAKYNAKENVKKAIKVRQTKLPFLYTSLRHRAKKRGIKFDLTFDKFREIKSTGCAFKNVRGHICGNMRHNGKSIFITIDRLSNGAYTDDDVIGLCERGNMIKNAISEGEVEYLYLLFKSRGDFETEGLK